MIVDSLEKWLLAALATASSVVLWAYRKLLSNEKRIAALEKDVEAARDIRKMDHESIKEVKSMVNEIKSFLMESK